MENKTRKTMTVAEMGHMLGLKKTDSYWLVHKKQFETILIDGKMRVVIASFEKWYANQIKHRKVNGPPPGEELRAYSYSVQEIAEMLEISSDTAYVILQRDKIPTFTVDHWRRVRKEDYDRWYAGQSKFRNAEDRARDADLEEASMTIPEMGRLLLIDRRAAHAILERTENRGKFEYVWIAGRRRVTKVSFEAWYAGQTKYRKFEDLPPEEQEQILQKNRVKQMPRLVVKTDKSAYSVQEAMVLLELNRREIMELIHSGELEAKKYAGKYMILRDDIQWWLHQQKLNQENT